MMAQNGTTKNADKGSSHGNGSVGDASGDSLQEEHGDRTETQNLPLTSSRAPASASAMIGGAGTEPEASAGVNVDEHMEVKAKVEAQVEVETEARADTQSKRPNTKQDTNDGESSHIFLNKPSTSELDSTQRQANSNANNQIFYSSGSFSGAAQNAHQNQQHQQQHQQQHAHPPIPARNHSYANATISPGNTSLSSFESQHINGTKFYFSPGGAPRRPGSDTYGDADSEHAHKNDQSINTGPLKPTWDSHRADATSRHSNDNDNAPNVPKQHQEQHPNHHADYGSEHVMPPSSLPDLNDLQGSPFPERRQPPYRPTMPRSAKNSEHDNYKSTASASSAFSESQKRQLHTFLTDLRVSSEGKLKQAEFDSTSSFASSYHPPNQQDQNRPHVNSIYRSAPKELSTLATSSAADGASTAVVAGTIGGGRSNVNKDMSKDAKASVISNAQDSPSQLSQVIPTLTQSSLFLLGDDIVDMTLSASADESDLGETQIISLSREDQRDVGANVDGRNKVDEGCAPPNQKSRPCPDDEKKAAGSRRSRRRNVDNNRHHHRQRSGDAAAAALVNGGQGWKGMEQDQIPLPSTYGDTDDDDSKLGQNVPLTRARHSFSADFGRSNQAFSPSNGSGLISPSLGTIQIPSHTSGSATSPKPHPWRGRRDPKQRSGGRKGASSTSRSARRHVRHRRALSASRTGSSFSVAYKSVAPVVDMRTTIHPTSFERLQSPRGNLTPRSTTDLQTQGGRTGLVIDTSNLYSADHAADGNRPASSKSRPISTASSAVSSLPSPMVQQRQYFFQQHNHHQHQHQLPYASHEQPQYQHSNERMHAEPHQHNHHLPNHLSNPNQLQQNTQSQQQAQRYLHQPPPPPPPPPGPVPAATLRSAISPRSSFMAQVQNQWSESAKASMRKLPSGLPTYNDSPRSAFSDGSAPVLATPANRWQQPQQQRQQQASPFTPSFGSTHAQAQAQPNVYNPAATSPWGNNSFDSSVLGTTSWASQNQYGVSNSRPSGGIDLVQSAGTDDMTPLREPQSLNICDTVDTKDRKARTKPTPTPTLSPKIVRDVDGDESRANDLPSNRADASPRRQSTKSGVFGQKGGASPDRSPFANMNRRFRLSDRRRFRPMTSTLQDDDAEYPTYICPNCKTRQREFFTVSSASGQFESAAGYIAFYFSVYVMAALYIFGMQEGWPALDCIYFAVITLTTAGLGDLAPTSDGAKIMCSVFIYFGVACIGLLLGSYIAKMLDESSRREAKENRINSCPNCTRLQNIQDAAINGGLHQQLFQTQHASPLHADRSVYAPRPSFDTTNGDQSVERDTKRQRKHIPSTVREMKTVACFSERPTSTSSARSNSRAFIHIKDIKSPSSVSVRESHIFGSPQSASSNSFNSGPMLSPKESADSKDIAQTSPAWNAVTKSPSGTITESSAPNPGTGEPVAIAGAISSTTATPVVAQAKEQAAVQTPPQTSAAATKSTIDMSPVQMNNGKKSTAATKVQNNSHLGSPLTAQILGRQSHTRHESLDLNGRGSALALGSTWQQRKFSAELPPTFEDVIGGNTSMMDGMQSLLQTPMPNANFLRFNQQQHQGMRQEHKYQLHRQGQQQHPLQYSQLQQQQQQQNPFGGIPAPRILNQDLDAPTSDGSSTTSSVDGVVDLEDKYSMVKNGQYVFLTLREALMNSMFIIAFGCLGFYFIEDFSVVDSWYFTTVLLTTVGYGDITPVTKGGKLFATVYILVAGTLLLHNMSLISMIPLELRKRRIEKAVLTQFGDQLDDAALRELATGPLIRRLNLCAQRPSGLDECTREMFALAMLVRLGKVTEDDILSTFSAFQKLDVYGTGILNSGSIIGGMYKNRKSVMVSSAGGPAGLATTQQPQQARASQALYHRHQQQPAAAPSSYWSFAMMTPMAPAASAAPANRVGYASQQPLLGVDGVSPSAASMSTSYNAI